MCIALACACSVIIRPGPWSGSFDGDRFWKGLDWAVTGRLFEKGLIEDPKGKAKSLVLTKDGLARAETVLRTMFAANEGSAKCAED